MATVSGHRITQSSTTYRNLKAFSLNCSLYIALFASLLLFLQSPAVARPFNILDDGSTRARPWSVATLEYYVQVELGGADLGVLIPAIDSNTTNNFGHTELFAFNVTEGADPTSTQLGYVRGYTVQASYTSTAHGVEVEIVSYDDGYLNGTISIQGLINTSTNEVAIVGGTGDFRGVRGYGIISEVNSTETIVLFHHKLHFL